MGEPTEDSGPSATVSFENEVLGARTVGSCHLVALMSLSGHQLWDCPLVSALPEGVLPPSQTPPELCCLDSFGWTAVSLKSTSISPPSSYHLSTFDL